MLDYKEIPFQKSFCGEEGTLPLQYKERASSLDNLQEKCRLFRKDDLDFGSTIARLDP